MEKKKSTAVEMAPADFSKAREIIDSFNQSVSSNKTEFERDHELIVSSIEQHTLKEQEEKERKAEEERQKSRKSIAPLEGADCMALFSRYFALRERPRKIFLKAFAKHKEALTPKLDDSSLNGRRELRILSPEIGDAAKRIFAYLVSVDKEEADIVIRKAWQSVTANHTKVSERDDFFSYMEKVDDGAVTNDLPDYAVNYAIFLMLNGGLSREDDEFLAFQALLHDLSYLLQFKEIASHIKKFSAKVRQLGMRATPMETLRFADMVPFMDDYLAPLLSYAEIDPYEIIMPVLSRKDAEIAYALGLAVIRDMTEGEEPLAYFPTRDETDDDIVFAQQSASYLGLGAVILNLALRLRKSRDKAASLQDECAKLRQKQSEWKADRKAAVPAVDTSKKDADIRRLQTENDKLRIKNRELESELASLKEYAEQLKKAEESLSENDSARDAGFDTFDLKPSYPDGTILVGGHPRWQKFVAQKYPGLKILDGENKGLNVDCINSSTPLLLINPTHITHPAYWKATAKAERAGIHVEFVYPRKAEKR